MGKVENHRKLCRGERRGGELKADVGNRLVVRAQWQVRLERAVGATEGPGAEE